MKDGAIQVQWCNILTKKRARKVEFWLDESISEEMPLIPFTKTKKLNRQAKSEPWVLHLEVV